MKKYLTFFRLYLKDGSAYKIDIILSMAINVVYFMIQFAVWKAIYTSSGVSEINSYSISSTITYHLIGTVFFKIDSAEQIMLSDWIWEGELTKDLIKPWNIKFVQFIMYVANTLYSVVMYIPVLILLFLAFHNYVILPSFEYLIYFVITLVLVTILGLVFFGIFHCLTFFYGDQSGQISLIGYLTAGVAGGFFPLDFLPSNLAWFFNHLPFRFFFNTPAKIFLEKYSITEIYYNWVEMIIWIIIFYIIFHYLFKKGLTMFTGVGR